MRVGCREGRGGGTVTVHYTYSIHFLKRLHVQTLTHFWFSCTFLAAATTEETRGKKGRREEAGRRRRRRTTTATATEITTTTITVSMSNKTKIRSNRL